MIITSTMIAGTVVLGLLLNNVQHMQALKNQAVNECGLVSRFTYETQADGKTTRSEEPSKTVYQTCMQDKGYQSSVKIEN